MLRLGDAIATQVFGLRKWTEKIITLGFTRKDLEIKR
jgi:hypothetical protein